MVDMSTAVATDDEYMKRAFRTEDLSDLFSHSGRPDLVMMDMLGEANKINSRMNKGSVNLRERKPQWTGTL